MTPDQRTVSNPDLDYDLHRDKLLTYLHEGRCDPSYKEGTPYVITDDVKELTLRAGHTELALGALNRMGHTDLLTYRRRPQFREDRFSVVVYSPNRYGFEPGKSYDGIESMEHVALNFKPDLDRAIDPLRERILTELGEFEALKTNLWESGKRYFSLERWLMRFDGKVDYWLNPYDQRKYRAGWYSLAELKGWFIDDPESPVLLENEKRFRQQITASAVRRDFRSESQEELERLAKEGAEAKRLLRIALMGCPFSDQMARFSPLAFSELF